MQFLEAFESGKFVVRVGAEALVAQEGAAHLLFEGGAFDQELANYVLDELGDA